MDNSWLKKSKNGPFWRVLENLMLQTVLPDKSILLGQNNATFWVIFKHSAHGQLSHLAQFVKNSILNKDVFLNPLPNWVTGNLKALCLQPLTSLSKIAMNFRSLLVSNSLYKQDCASGWLTCPAAWVKRLSVIIHFYKLEEQEGFFRPPICWQRDFIGYISLAFLLNSSLFYEK